MASTSDKDFDPVSQLNNKMSVLLALGTFFLLDFVYDLTSGHKPIRHLFDFYWIATSLGMIGYCWYNLRIVRRLLNTTVPQKERIEKDVSMLESSLKKMDLSSDIFLVIAVVALEILIYFHGVGRYTWTSHSLDDWSSLPFFARASVYLIVCALVCFRRRHPFWMDYRQHIWRLRELVDLM